MEKISSREVRPALKENIARGLAGGAFGVPTFVVEKNGSKELFWGQESLEYLQLYLQGKDLLNQNLYTKFKEVFAANPSA